MKYINNQQKRCLSYNLMRCQREVHYISMPQRENIKEGYDITEIPNTLFHFNKQAIYIKTGKGAHKTRKNTQKEINSHTVHKLSHFTAIPYLHQAEQTMKIFSNTIIVKNFVANY